MKKLLALIVAFSVSAFADLYQAPLIVATIADLTNSVPITKRPHVLVLTPGNGLRETMFTFSPGSTSAVSSPLVLPARSSGRWILNGSLTVPNGSVSYIAGWSNNPATGVPQLASILMSDVTSNKTAVYVDTLYLPSADFGDTSEIDIDASAGSVTAALRDASIGLARLSSATVSYFATDSELASHAATVSGVHGISVYGATLVSSTTQSSARTVLGLGTSAVLNVAASGDADSGEVVKGNDSRLSDARTPLTHNHDGSYDPWGTSSNAFVTHLAAGDPHPAYVLEASGNASDLTLNSSVNLNIGSDLASGGSHRALVRDVTTGNMRTMTASYFKGWLDILAADISDAGTKGRLLLQSGTTANALDELGTGRSGALFLRGDGAWATPPTGTPGTNGIPDAPNDGTAYVRKSEAWTGLDIGDVGGMTAFGLDWIETTTDDVEALDKLNLIGSGVATIDSPATHVSRINSTGSGTARHRNNFIAGTGIGLALTDDSVSDEADITVSLADGDRGDYSVSSGTATIDAGVVSYSKIQSVTASRLLGRGDSGAGAPQELTAGAGLVISGTTMSVDPAYYMSGQVLLVTSDEVSLTGTSLTDESWHNILGTARVGTSKTIAANALAVGSVIKIELHGTMGYQDSAATLGSIRIKVGSSLSVTMQHSEEDSYGCTPGSPWMATIVLTVKSGSTLVSGFWQYHADNGTPGGYITYMARPAATGSIDPTLSNLIEAEFYGSDVTGPHFTEMICNQAIVTRL